MIAPADTAFGSQPMSTEMPQPLPCFIDSNLWIYALTIQDDPTKTHQANQLISSQPSIMLSTQVINEVCVNLLKKADFTESEVRDIADDFFVQYTVITIGQEIIRKASLLREQHHLSFWDGLIVASALISGASVLFSEDMHDGLTIEGLTIVNPFHSR
ncbi:MAG TPA: PIN domain-containing protein [Roseiflexaceae bacterium]|nr:PIN domain-containing protein [Roseiflexaceae bacterium]